MTSDVVARRRPTVIETDASSSFECDYVAGINRVLSLAPYLLVDNIARNIELWRFQSGDCEPVTRALYNVTSYPDDPMASLLDVDIHAAFLHREHRELLVINHYGRVRRFDLPTPAGRMHPTGELQLLGDTERVVMAGDCFVASSPRGEFTDDAAQPGVFLFEPLAEAPEWTSADPRRLGWDQVLAGWGVVSALAVSPTADRLAVAAGQRLGVFSLTCGSSGLRFGDCLWEAPLRFHCQWLHFGEPIGLWAAGHRPSLAGAQGGDWDACRGGSIDALGVDDGAQQFSAVLPEATAWGYGADPVVMARGAREVYVLSRDGALHAINMNTGVAHQLYEALEPRDVAVTSLGIGHAALRDGWLYAGFSRGGFRLLRYDLRIQA